MTAPQRKAHFRAHPRRRLVVDGTLTHDAGWTVSVRVVDVGMGGVGIETNQNVAPTDRVTVLLLAPSLWDPLILPGRIAWTLTSDTGNSRAGIVFENVDKKILLALFELLATS